MPYVQSDYEVWPGLEHLLEMVLLAAVSVNVEDLWWLDVSGRVTVHQTVDHALKTSSLCCSKNTNKDLAVLVPDVGCPSCSASTFPCQLLNDLKL